MRNVTVVLEEEVARWACIRAAERDTSVSRFVGELLREKMIEERDYKSAMRYFLSQPARALRPAGRKYPRREQLHER